jgi:hypothetical protein
MSQRHPIASTPASHIACHLRQRRHASSSSQVAPPPEAELRRQADIATILMNRLIFIDVTPLRHLRHYIEPLAPAEPPADAIFATLFSLMPLITPRHWLRH